MVFCHLREQLEKVTKITDTNSQTHYWRPEDGLRTTYRSIKKFTDQRTLPDEIKTIPIELLST